MLTLYTQSHEWLRYEAAEVVIGITNHGQKSLGEIAFVELPAVGVAVAKGQTLCVVESVKAASEILSPVSGVVRRVNQDLVERPQLINSSAEQDGWLCVLGAEDGVRAGAVGEEFLSADQYTSLVG